MSAFFGYLSVAQNYNVVGFHYGCESVCDDDECVAAGEVFYGFLYLRLSLVVDSRCSLVKHEYRSFSQHCTCDSNTLLLSAREPYSALSYLCHVSIRHFADKFVGTGGFRGGIDFFLGCVLRSVRYVFVYRIVEEEYILQYYGNVLSE